MPSNSTAAESSRKGQQGELQREDAAQKDRDLDSIHESIDNIYDEIEDVYDQIGAVARQVDKILVTPPAETAAANSDLEMLQFRTAIIRSFRETDALKRENQALKNDVAALKYANAILADKIRTIQKALNTMARHLLDVALN